jgi:hypothetical protein
MRGTVKSTDTFVFCSPIQCKPTSCLPLLRTVRLVVR